MGISDPVYLPMEIINGKTITGGTKAMTSLAGEGSLVPGIRLNALMLDGNTTYLLDDGQDSCFTNPALCQNGMSMSFWLKAFSNINNSYYLFGNGAHSVNPSGYSVFILERRIHVVIKSVPFTWLFISNTSIVMDEWSLIAFSWHRDHGLKVYNDGIQSDGKAYAFYEGHRPPSFTPYIVGTPHDGIGALDPIGQFAIDELSFCDQVVPDQEMQHIFLQVTGKQEMTCYTVAFSWSIIINAQCLNTIVLFLKG